MSLHHTILRIRQHLQKKIVLHINFKRVPWYLFQAIHYLKWSDHFRMFYSAGKVSAGPTRIFTHTPGATDLHPLVKLFVSTMTHCTENETCLVSFDYFFLKMQSEAAGFNYKIRKGMSVWVFLIIKFCSYSYKYFLLGNDFGHN